jgi:hypothetical protein
MNRGCTRCGRRFTTDDLARDESRNLERERRAAGLEGVRFLYLHCPDCGTNDIFVVILPRLGESSKDLRARRDEMEAVVRTLPHGQAEVVVLAVQGPRAPEAT